jgi:hypothetical protein
VTSSVNDAVQSIDNNLSNLTKKAIRQLPSDHHKYLIKVDAAGKRLTKVDLLKNGGNGFLTYKKEVVNNPYKLIFKDRLGNPLDKLPIKNGNVDFTNISYLKLRLSDGRFLDLNRDKNFANFDLQLRELVRNHDDSVPQLIYDYLKGNDINFEFVTTQEIEEMRMIKNLYLTWHEVEDGVSGMLVPGVVHRSISHAGGISVIKFMITNRIPLDLLYARVSP